MLGRLSKGPARWALTATALALAMIPLSVPTAGADDPGGPRAVAADGTTQAITAINPSSRTAGVFALYTPEFGASTKTNQYGGEAVLRETSEAGAYRVDSVCTAFTTCARPGDNAIPADGVVLSASPGGDPDVRLFLRDRVRAGDLVRLADLKVRTVSSSLDATDPTAANNPAGVDPASGKCYPGCRGADQLIAYTAAFGARTGTNDFGFEVDVVNGRVVARGGNDRAIPRDGFVLSGHGARGNWLSSNAVLGAKVTIDGAQVTIVVDAQTYIYGAEQSVARAQQGLAQAGAECLEFPADSAQSTTNEAVALLAEARAAAEVGDTDGAVALAERSRTAADLGLYRTRESRPVEGRAIWVRPVETTPAQIEQTLDRLSTAGFNMVFVETVWQGYTIYPSEVAGRYGIAPQRPEMAGFDPLKHWIDGAHARGMELHPWVHTFFVGAQAVNENGGPGPVLTAHPEWAAVEREDVGKPGPQPSSQEPGYYFVDPSIPAVRNYVRSVFEEILTKYAADGLHLDYIRYPVSLPWETAAFSYSDHSRQAFEREHGADPYTLTPADPLWTTWNKWREQQVTSFVAEVRAMQRSVAPNAPVSAAVFPNPSDGLAKKFQNWDDWVDKGYVDFLTGMSFGTSGESVAAETTLMRDAVGAGNLLYTATYGPFRSSTPDVILEQVQAVRDAGADGAALFAYNQLSAPQATALVEGVFRTKAVVPHKDLAAAARTGLGSTIQGVENARGTCTSVRTARELTRHLRAADRWLRLGKSDRAVNALTTAARVLSHDEAAQPGYRARVLRDLDMYERWIRRSAQLR